MAWGAQVTSINGYDVSVNYAEDKTGETLDEIITVPNRPDPSWLSDYVTNRIVDLTKRTEVSQAVSVGPVQYTSSILDSFNISASTIQPVTTPPVTMPPTLS